ncbi:MAG: hypothetical protein CFH01_00687 [Alphaproteobacteria bacterium MarineAlpha2_Bin1]|nr:MAG: hypothetical protein CFH01_00687 [Alphaproteobacteria bacterium MarineAlpha2_Bin1]|tara:strand:+ start:1195 stop:1395 length:201 start_codon:yes stop_codon:yes gene_type:complete
MTNKTALPNQNISGEKKGNISWIQCNFCEQWFHSTKELIEFKTIDLYCPNCHEEFKPEKSKKIIIA